MVGKLVYTQSGGGSIPSAPTILPISNLSCRVALRMYVTHFSIQGSKPFAGWKIAELLRLFDDMQQQPSPGSQQVVSASAASGKKPKMPLGRRKGKSKAMRIKGRRRPSKSVDWRNPW